MTTPPQQDNEPEPTLGGVTLSECFLAAGFCAGLAYRTGLNLDQQDKKFLIQASAIIKAAADRARYETITDKVPKK